MTPFLIRILTHSLTNGWERGKSIFSPKDQCIPWCVAVCESGMKWVRGQNHCCFVLFCFSRLLYHQMFH